MHIATVLALPPHATIIPSTPLIWKPGSRSSLLLSFVVNCNAEQAFVPELGANGTGIKTVRTRAGHANPSISLSWHAHAIPENVHEAAQPLGNILNQENTAATLPGDATSSKMQAERERKGPTACFLAIGPS